LISQSVVDQFVQNATKVDVTITLVEDQEELRRTLQHLLAGNTLIYCPMETDIERNAGIPRDRLTPDYIESFFTVEEVPAAIAETGTIVCWSKEGRPVQASLLPVRHVASVRQECIFMNLKDFFEALGDRPPTNVTFITGPSRTADIELTLTTGVHGPEKVDIIVCLRYGD
jgi:L-lactate dehydrogenase complex protein LldG